MKRRLIPTVPSFELALLGLGLALAAALGALVRALGVHDRTTAARETIVIPSTLRPPGDASGARYVAIADDPFFPGRTPPATRYRLAADAPAPEPEPEKSPNDLPVPVVVGTVVGADGSSFAICRVNDEPPQSVRVGGSIGGYRLDSIERGRAVFVTPTGQRVAVTSSTGAGSTGAGRPADTSAQSIELPDLSKNEIGDRETTDVRGLA